MKRFLVLTATVALVIGAAAVASSTLLLVETGLISLAGVAAVIETIVWNGHRYYLISESTAANAVLEAQAPGGHLATINSQAEQKFVWSTRAALLPPMGP